MNDGLDDFGKAAAAVLVALCIAMLIVCVFV
jgi:hypothetical protein